MTAIPPISLWIPHIQDLDDTRLRADMFAIQQWAQLVRQMTLTQVEQVDGTVLTTAGETTICSLKVGPGTYLCLAPVTYTNSVSGPNIVELSLKLTTAGTVFCALNNTPDIASRFSTTLIGLIVVTAADTIVLQGLTTIGNATVNNATGANQLIVMGS